MECGLNTSLTAHEDSLMFIKHSELKSISDYLLIPSSFTFLSRVLEEYFVSNTTSKTHNGLPLPPHYGRLPIPLPQTFAWHLHCWSPPFFLLPCPADASFKAGLPGGL